MEKAIVCVDDEKIVLDSLQEQLESRFGDAFVYEIAESVDEAWELIEDLEADEVEVVLVITDWLMPRIKGDQFLVDLHAKKPNVIKVMLTGQADPEAVQNAMENANLYAYVKKPWREEDFMNRLQTALYQNKVLD
jgi:DNA-binding NtrC family response regulator